MAGIMSRCLLHKSRLDAFKLWCEHRAIQTRPGRGDYQVLQVLTSKFGWQVVYDRNDAPEHYTVTWPLEMLVKRFIRDSTLKEDDNT